MSAFRISPALMLNYRRAVCLAVPSARKRRGKEKNRFLAFMPPTAVEIKARLDKAVDQEGNVLDVKAALEIMNYLETNVITKEALETTRIGRTINLMRKKTTNEDLAKRAKKLVKKWQFLISNHLKTLKAESPRPVTPPQPRTPPTINGTAVKRKNNDRPNSRTGTIDHLNKANLKRKRTNTGDSPLLLKQGLSPKLNIIRGSSVSPLGKVQKVEPEKGRAASPLLSQTTAIHNNKQSSHDATNTENDLANKEPNETGVKGDSNVPSIKNNHDEHVKGIMKATDTRCQEDRITKTYMCQETGTPSDVACTASNLSKSPQTLETLDSLSTENSHDAGSTQSLPVDDAPRDEKRTFEPIPEENLSVKRKELPEDYTSPESKADGINGAYNGDDEWSNWTEMVIQRGEELHILPYVILD